MSYLCSCCGAIHEGLPDLAFDRPSLAFEIPEEERGDRLWLSADLCVIDREYHFIRGLIEIPVHAQVETLGIGAWVSQKPENFHTYIEHFDSAEIGPFFGWLANEFVFGGQPTLGLKTMAYFRGGSLCPRIELEATDHPLAVAQREGITMNEAWTFIHRYSDPPGS